MKRSAYQETQASHGNGPEMPATEAQWRLDMRGYAVTVRELAYTVPNGVGERALLQLSERMATRAEQSFAP